MFQSTNQCIYQPNMEFLDVPHPFFLPFLSIEMHHFDPPCFTTSRAPFLLEILASCTGNSAVRHPLEESTALKNTGAKTTWWSRSYGQAEVEVTMTGWVKTSDLVVDFF